MVVRLPHGGECQQQLQRRTEEDEHVERAGGGLEKLKASKRKYQKQCQNGKISRCSQRIPIVYGTKTTSLSQSFNRCCSEFVRARAWHRRTFRSPHFRRSSGLVARRQGTSSCILPVVEAGVARGLCFFGGGGGMSEWFSPVMMSFDFSRQAAKKDSGREGQKGGLLLLLLLTRPPPPPNARTLSLSHTHTHTHTHTCCLFDRASLLCSFYLPTVDTFVPDSHAHSRTHALTHSRADSFLLTGRVTSLVRCLASLFFESLLVYLIP